MRVVVSGLSAQSAAAIRAELHNLGWTYEAEDAFERSLSHGDQIIAGNEPYQIGFDKPDAGDTRFISLAGFASWLTSKHVAGFVRVVGSLKPFSTGTFTVTDWETDLATTPKYIEELKDPRSVVREHGTSYVPSDVRPYILGQGEDLWWSDPVFQVWAQVAGVMLARSLATNIREGGEMVFGGPPSLVTPPPLESNFEALTSSGFKALQYAVRWVYENPRETDTKHKFLSIEIARSPSAKRSEPPFDLFASVLEHALESANLAYSLSLSEISRDTLRSLSDLRKTLADEASKALETARQVYSAVAAAVFASLGIVIARLAGHAPVYAVRALAVVIVLYLGGLAASAIFQKVNQSVLREAWRPHLYRFISDSDYKKMVLDPINMASKPLWVSIAVSLLAAVGLFFALWFLPEKIGS